MRCRIVVRDISTFPHADLGKVPILNELQVLWGEMLPPGYAVLFDLGSQAFDFRGGVDLTDLAPQGEDLPEPALSLQPQFRLESPCGKRVVAGTEKAAKAGVRLHAGRCPRCKEIKAAEEAA